MSTKSGPPTVVSILNLKGGVGKTTIAALLARHAAERGLDVLAVDLDPQANLSQALMGEDDYTRLMNERQPTIVELFDGYQPASSTKPGPTALELDNVIKEIDIETAKLHLVPSRFDFSDNLVRAIQFDEKILARFIANKMQGKNLILIDCAPTESILTRASYYASRYILIPTKTELFSTIGFPLMEESLKNFRNTNLGHTIDVCGVIIRETKTSGQPPSLDGRNSLQDIMQKAESYGWHVFENRMFHSDAYPRWAGNPIAGYLRNAGQEWPKLADEVLAKLGLI